MAPTLTPEQLGLGGASTTPASGQWRSTVLPRIVANGASAEIVQEARPLEHPNIVPIHDIGLDEDGNYFFVMKYLDGETLESIIGKLRDGNPEYHANRRMPNQRRAEGIVPIQCHITFTQRVVGEFMRFVNRRPFVFTFMLAVALATLAWVVARLLARTH